MSFLNELMSQLGGSGDTSGLLGMALLNAGGGGGGGLLNSLTAMKMLGMGDKPWQNPDLAQSTSVDPKAFVPSLPQANFAQASPQENPVSRLAWAVGQTESGGKYDALGPLTKGDRAYGRYQVMGSNIPSWSKEVLGRSVTPQEFLSNPSLQDQIAQAKLGQYYNKYGNINDAASMWFSGRPMAGNASRDVLGTSVPSYARKVNQFYYGTY